MNRNFAENELKCSVAQALSLIGDSWSILILRDFMIFGGTRRFEQLREALGISRNVLTERLRTLYDQEIIRKSPVEEGARRMEYKLSRKGWQLMPIMLAFHQWYERWRSDPVNSAFKFKDALSNSEIAQISVFSKDGRELGPSDLYAYPATESAKKYLDAFKSEPKKTEIKKKLAVHS